MWLSMSPWQRLCDYVSTKGFFGLKRENAKTRMRTANVSNARVVQHSFVRARYERNYVYDNTVPLRSPSSGGGGAQAWRFSLRFLGIFAFVKKKKRKE